jgi:hypothetical protein
LAVTAWVLFRLTPESDAALKSESGHG